MAKKRKETLVAAEDGEFKGMALKLLSLNLAFEASREGSLGSELGVLSDILNDEHPMEAEDGEGGTVGR